MEYGRKLTAFVLIASVLWLSAPGAVAQDVITSEDFSGGASVYTFRENRMAKRRTVAVKKGYVPRRNAERRRRNRDRLRSQRETVARVSTRRPRAKRVDPKLLPKAAPRTAAARTKASNDFAGAGESYLAANDTKAAEEAFRKSLSFNPRNAEARTGLSDALARKAEELASSDQNADALAAFEESIGFDPQNADAHAGMAAVYDSEDRAPEAIVAYEKALAAGPELDSVYAPLGVLYYRSGEIAKAESALQKARASDPENPEAALYLGLVAFKSNDTDRALTEINSALRSSPNYSDALYYRGAVHNGLGRADEAASDYQKAIFVEPGFSDAIVDLGTTQYNQQKFDLSAKTLQRATEVDPASGDAHFGLAESYRQLEDYPRANASYQQASETIKDDADLYSNWGYTLGREKRWEESAARLQTATDRRGDAVDHSNLGWAYNRAAEEDLRNGREADAAAKFEAGRKSSAVATERDQTLASGFVNLGTSLNGLKDHENATNALRRAVQLRDDWYFAHNELGRALRGWGKLAEAVIEFQRVVSLNRTWDRGLFNLGEAQYASGDKKGAERTMKELRKLNPALAGQLDNILKGRIDQEKRKVEQKVKDKTINKIPRLPF